VIIFSILTNSVAIFIMMEDCLIFFKTKPLHDSRKKDEDGVDGGGETVSSHLHLQYTLQV